MIRGLLSLLSMLPGLILEIHRAVRLYRKAMHEGWAKEYQLISDAIEKAPSNEDRARLAAAASELMRKSD